MFFDSRVGDGATGIGVWTEVLASIERRILSDNTYWQDLCYGDFVTLKLPDHTLIPHSAETLQYFRGVGFFFRLLLNWKREPIRVSPILFAFLISKSFEISTSQELLQVVVPDLAEKLAHWPPSSPDEFTGVDDASYLVSQVFDNTFTIPYLQSRSPEQLNALTSKIRHTMAFNCSTQLFTLENPLIRALIEGLHLSNVDGQLNIFGAFGRRPQNLYTYLGAVWPNRFPNSWNSLLPFFSVNHIVSAGSEFESQERGFIAQLLRYLHRSESNCIKFLKTVTALHYLPPLGKKFKITFRTQLPDDACCSFHTCTYAFEVLHSHDTKILFLGHFPDDLTTDTSFDTWFDAILLPGEFNNA